MRSPYTFMSGMPKVKHWSSLTSPRANFDGLTFFVVVDASHGTKSSESAVTQYVSHLLSNRAAHSVVEVWTRCDYVLLCTETKTLEFVVAQCVTHTLPDHAPHKLGEERISAALATPSLQHQDWS
jgi:hypothetical protein